MTPYIFQKDATTRLDRILLWVSGISFVVFGLLNGISPRGGGHTSILGDIPNDLYDEIFYLNVATTIILIISSLWLGIRVTGRLAKRGFVSQTLHLLGRACLYIFLPSIAIAALVILISWLSGNLTP